MKHSILQTVLLNLFFLPLLFQSCTTDRECITYINFTIVDSSYNNLVGKTNSCFLLDSVNLLNQEKKIITQLHSKFFKDTVNGELLGWVFSYIFVDGYSNSDLDYSKLKKVYYLYLNKENIDTIKIDGINNGCSAFFVKFNSKVYKERQPTNIYSFIK